MSQITVDIVVPTWLQHERGGGEPLRLVNAGTTPATRAIVYWVVVEVRSAKSCRYRKSVIAAAATPAAGGGSAIQTVWIGSTAYEVIILRLESVVVDEVFRWLAARLLLGLSVAARTVGRGEPRWHWGLGRRGGRWRGRGGAAHGARYALDQINFRIGSSLFTFFFSVDSQIANSCYVLLPNRRRWSKGIQFVILLQ